jgi:hypothetical protein
MQAGHSIDHGLVHVIADDAYALPNGPPGTHT